MNLRSAAKPAWCDAGGQPCPWSIRGAVASRTDTAGHTVGHCCLLLWPVSLLPLTCTMLGLEPSSLQLPGGSWIPGEGLRSAHVSLVLLRTVLCRQCRVSAVLGQRDVSCTVPRRTLPCLWFHEHPLCLQQIHLCCRLVAYSDQASIIMMGSSSFCASQCPFNNPFLLHVVGATPVLKREVLPGEVALACHAPTQGA